METQAMITAEFTKDDLGHLHNAMALLIKDYCDELSGAAYKIDMSEEAYMAGELDHLVQLQQTISRLTQQSWQQRNEQ
jgi:hypothetical protein